MNQQNFEIIKALAIFLIAGAFLHLQSAAASDTIFKEVKVKNDGAPGPTAQKAAQREVRSASNAHSFGIGFGQSFLQGDFDKNGEDQIVWDLFYNYKASHSFEMLINFHHSKHEFKTTYAKIAGLNLGIKAKFYEYDAFAPYALGGFGFYAPKLQRIYDNQLVETESKFVFGYHLGVGVDLRLNDRFAVGMLAHYHNPFDIKQEAGPEVDGSYAKLLLTLFYSI